VTGCKKQNKTTKKSYSASRPVIDEDRFVANAGGFTMHMNH
jgi:hypothetical protein